jgi:hypothetical protein
MTLTASCAARVCTLDASAPTGYSATAAAAFTYIWKVGYMSIGGTNMRRQVITFGSPGTYTIVVEARNGSTLVATATKVLTIN